MEIDIRIFKDVMRKTDTKAAISRYYKISPRTVGRAVARVEKHIIHCALNLCVSLEGLAYKLALNVDDVTLVLQKAICDRGAYGISYTDQEKIKSFLDGRYETFAKIIAIALKVNKEHEICDVCDVSLVRLSEALHDATINPKRYSLSNEDVQTLENIEPFETSIINYTLTEGSNLQEIATHFKVDKTYVIELLKDELHNNGDEYTSTEKLAIERYVDDVDDVPDEPHDWDWGNTEYDWDDEDAYDEEFGMYDDDCDGIESELDSKPEPKSDNNNENVEDYIITGNSRSITIIRADGETRSIEHTNKLFDNVYNIVKNGIDRETLKQAFDEMSFATVVNRYSDGVLTVDCANSKVVAYPDTAHEVVFTNKLAERLLTECYNNFDGDSFKTLKSFTRKLALADNPEVIAELYDFVSANDITIDEDGYVICWKKVQADYTDIHSGTFDNTPGEVCEIPAHTVDPNRQNTCSYGLHVCSKSYLPCFGSSYGNRVVKVRVHPRDFIAIPNDYDNAKARVSKYTVLEDVTEQML